MDNCLEYSKFWYYNLFSLFYAKTMSNSSSIALNATELGKIANLSSKTVCFFSCFFKDAIRNTTFKGSSNWKRIGENLLDSR